MWYVYKYTYSMNMYIYHLENYHVAYMQIYASHIYIYVHISFTVLEEIYQNANSYLWMLKKQDLFLFVPYIFFEHPNTSSKIIYCFSNQEKNILRYLSKFQCK